MALSKLFSSARAFALVVIVGALVGASSQAFAQGFLIIPSAPRPLPRPHVIVVPDRPAPIPYRIEEETVEATINGSVAKVSLSQKFKNEGSSTIEASFVFPLPYDGAVNAMTLLVDGKELEGKLLDAKEARSQYQEIVRKARDPALLEWVGTGMYQTSVFPIPAGESRVVSIEYEQVLRSRDGLTEFFFPMRAGKYTVKPIDKVEFSLTIVGDTEVKNVYSPTYDITTERVGKNVVKVNSKLTNQTPSSDFRLFFDQNADDLSAKIQSYRPDDQDDGYFMLLASPKIVSEESEPLPKTIVFALDVSGSMTGQKIKQARESLEFVLKRLRKGDKFNIILFNGEVQSYSDKLVVVDEETRANALAYVAATRASGSTNIGEALIRSFASLDQADDSNPKYLFFLSDGEPVTGETNEMKLAQIAREKNKSKSRFFTFGVGYDVNSRLLDRFVSDGRGIGEYVKEDETIEAHVASLYSRVEEPVFTNVTFEFSLKSDADKKYITNLVYPSGDVDVFAGEQLALVGRYSAPGDVVVTARGKVGDKDVEFQYEGTFESKSADASYAYVERIWANRRIGQIIDELDLNGENKELVDELVALAKKHGVVTPYTSFLADDSVDLNAHRNAGVAMDNFRRLASNTSGMSGFGQRAMKQAYRNSQNLSASADSAAAESNAMALSAAAAPAPAPSASMGSLPRGAGRGRVATASAARNYGGGMGGGMGGMGMVGGAVLQTADADASARPSGQIRNVAGKTFYFKKDRWIDESITEDMEKNQKPVVIKQFSDEYFSLLDENTTEISQYLVFSEPIALNLSGQIYYIDPADAE
ncbi:MAG: VWA domain-containing protein [Thermoguttaceae bacterium]|nr:VWA domain-containing protein [Thermoguttaceae bacterium]